MKNLLLVFLTALSIGLSAQSPRERINFDDQWFFAFGHPFDKTKDFNTGTGYFSYLAKAGYGDGAASEDFDHRAWRPLDLPHDWAVEMPFDAKGSHSHGYKAVGPGFPEVSVGWYRKTFTINKEDFGKQIFLDFDGVSRDSKVWVNGHYLGNEPSGYQSFSYNITDILNYGGDNVVAVRADVSMEEGWYYEGAGIYRHVWMRKTANLHIPRDGTFVHCNINGNKTEVIIETEIDNRGLESQHFSLKHQVLNKEGEVLGSIEEDETQISSMSKNHFVSSILVNQPKLWSLEDPYMHTMRTQVISNGEVVDEYLTPFGIRSIHFDADKGFFLNGKHVKLKGTNNHQDHAGVGCAIPNELLRWRIQQLKRMGSNAIRSSHNPATPELLQLCDEMGMLIIDENRLMGTTDKALHELERVMKRDRNHPSIIVWSLGNEEWGIECDVIGEQITRTMQSFAKNIDSTRAINVAISGGCNKGIASEIDVVGYNYLGQWDTDKHHSMFPEKPSIGTEEGSTYATRGEYIDDDEKHYQAAYDQEPRDNWYSIEEGWQHYASRDYLAGMFIWTGFDYRGEPTPYTWPSVTSYFGMMDLCGFPKDNVYYLKSWWQDEPVLHLLPHWNWKGKEGDTIDVWVYSNCEEVELELNGKSYRRKQMPVNGHLEWKVPYHPGTLKAIAYKKGEQVLTTSHKTSGKAAKIKVSAHKATLNADNKDLAVLKVEVVDKNGIPVPAADNTIRFEINGPGKIIGLGNGNPTSLEKEVFVDDYSQAVLDEVEILVLTSDSAKNLLSGLLKKEQKDIAELQNAKVLHTSFDLNKEPSNYKSVKWFFKHVAAVQRVYLNGQLLDDSVEAQNGSVRFDINPEFLQKGNNEILIVGEPFKPKHQWDKPNKKPGVIQMVCSADQPRRKLFNGLAQVIIQSTYDSGTIKIKALSEGLQSAEMLIQVKK